MDKEKWYTYTKEYYSAMKKKEILPFVTTCINLEDIILSEISQTNIEKDKYCMLYLYVESKKVELIQSESRMMVSRAWGVVGKMGDVGQCVQIFSYEMSKFCGSNV